jgi:uncharacterized small protein (DUF1192 family)
MDIRNLSHRIEELEAALRELLKETLNSSLFEMENKITEQAAEIERLKVEHISNCLFHRCLNHLHINQYNANEAAGSECCACAVEEEIGRLAAALRSQKDECDRFHKPA